MNSKYMLGVLLIAAVFASANCQQEKVKLTLYYESLCPYCSRFIENHLFPVYNKLGKEHIDLDFIPYGHANHELINGEWYFTCQHGEDECYGNLVQACALNQNYGQDLEMDYIHCVMSLNDPSDEEGQSLCAKEFHLSWDNIDACTKNGVGNELLAKYGDRTKAFYPERKPRVVPTVVFNDKYDENLQENGISNLLATICSLYTNKPQGCL